MLAQINRRSFAFPTGALLSAAQQLLGALQDNTFGSPLVIHLSPTFVDDFAAQISLVAKLSADQSVAIGSLSTLTLSQTAALADYVHLAGRARRAAKLAFAENGTLLSSGFQVGLTSPRSLAAMLDRGAKLLAACQMYAAELAAQNWSAASTEQLQHAFAGLEGIDRTQAAAFDGKIGLTAKRRVAAFHLYRQCVALQNAARTVYASAAATADASTVEARERFLLDEFPPRLRRPEVAVPAASAPASAPAVMFDKPMAV